MAPRYRLYGQSISSEVLFPGLPAAADPPSAFIEKGNLPSTVTELPGDGEHVHESDDGSTVVCRCSDAVYWVWRGIGTVHVRNGTVITVDANDGQPASAVRQLVLGPGFRSLLAQQGNLVLHGSAVSVRNEAAVFLGVSGSGKSTTAAALTAAGHTFLTDDIVPVREDADRYVLSAGPPAVRIQSTVARQLGYDIGGRSGPATAGRREYLTLSINDRSEEYPVSKLYLLHWGDGPTIDDPPTVDVVPELLRSSSPLPGGLEATALDEQFRRCLRLVDAVPVRRLCRPKSLSALDDVVSKLEADMIS